MTSLFARFILLFVALCFTSGCAQLLGSLRRDLYDGDEFADAAPTVGGTWAGSGFLGEDMPESGSNSRYVGHTERSPASAGRTARSADSWVDDEHASSNRRDAYRGQDAYDEDGSPNSGNSPSMEPAVRRQYKNGSRATRADFVDESQNEGSLWASDGQTNYYFTKNKIRGVGDIIQVTVEDALVRDIGLESRRSLSERERDYELATAQERIRLKTLGLDGDKKDSVGSSAAAPSRSPAGKDAAKGPDQEIDIPSASLADVDVTKSLELKTGDTMMGEIIERYPNGNYKIRASKKIPYKGGPPRNVSLVGVVKGSDISEEDTLSSGKLYEYRVEANR